MSLPKSAAPARNAAPRKKPGPWLLIGLLVILAAGVSLAGASRRPSARVPESRLAPAAAPASSVSRDAAGSAQADRDVCAQQLD